MPQRKSSTRQKSRRQQLDGDYVSKRKTGSKREHGFDEGYKTQPYEPNSPVQQEEEDLDDKCDDQDYKYQEGERPKKIASWQMAHKMEHDRNFAKI